MHRELFLLNPYRLPTHHTLMLAPEDAAVLLNGYLSLWHPEAIRGAVKPPEIASAYDHEQPQAGRIYAVSESPPLFLPEHWEELVRQAGARSFPASADRDATEQALRQALGIETDSPHRKALLQAVGLGYLLLGALCEAMDHENPLVVEDFWRDVQQAVETPDDDACREALRSAADRLREARRIVYDSTTHLLALVVLEERPNEALLPEGLEFGSALTLIASGRFLEKLGHERPEVLERIKQAVQAGTVEVAGGIWDDRADALLPVESQLWNLKKGLTTLRSLLGQPVTTFARRRFGITPHLPQFLNALGVRQAVLLTFDEGILPQFHSAVVEWYTSSGEQIRSFARKPLPADNPLTFFHLAYHLAKTLRNDMVSSLAFIHRSATAASYYRDWLRLHQLAPVFGQAATVDHFLGQAGHGEYSPPRPADDFHSDYLHEAVERKQADPVSRFREHLRLRRRVEDLGTLTALLRSLPRASLPPDLLQEWSALEDRVEAGEPGAADQVEAAFGRVGHLLAERLLARAAEDKPGWLIVNPCSFPRMMCLELEGVQTPLPAPAKATQVGGGLGRVVVETPALGFSWIPRGVPPGTRVPMPKGKLAEDRILRNEFLEAEVDPTTGGLRTIRPVRKPQGRLGQQIVFGPGSVMRAREIRVVSEGPAVGEIVSHGDLLDAADKVLARFTQRFRVWWARPVLELHLALELQQPPTGYPWHAFYGVRFAWRDPRTPLFRAVDFETYGTTHTRPETIEFVELRTGSDRTAILTGGLPFLQRQGNRMLDVILVPEGETRREFDLAIVLDADDPILAARAFVTPPIVVPVVKGPPHVGSSGWLFHIDAVNILVNSLRPAPDHSDAILARLAEIRGAATEAVFRCPRPPVRAYLVNEWDVPVSDLPVADDGVQLSFSANEMKRLLIHFS